MTSAEVNKINILTEENPEKLREVIKFWQDKAYTAQRSFTLLNEHLTSYLTSDKMNELDFEKMKAIIAKELPV